MTVAELIKMLQECNMDAVVFQSGDDYGPKEIETVEEVAPGTSWAAHTELYETGGVLLS